MKKLFYYSDKVISVSNYTKDKALAMVGKNQEIDVIPNFVDTNIYYPIDRTNYLKKYNLDKNDIVLLSLSRLVKRKGHFLVIGIIKKLIKRYSNIKYLDCWSW